MIFNKKILGVCKIAANDDYRPLLAHVHFIGGMAEATDGYMLLRIVMPKPESDDKGVEVKETLLPAKQIARIVREIHTSKKIPSVFHRAWVEKIDKSCATVSTTSFGSTMSVTMPVGEGDYPKTDKVIDPVVKTKAKAVTAFNPELMVKLIEAMRLSGVSKVIQMELRDPLQPIILRGTDDENNEVVGLLMPTRVSS